MVIESTVKEEVVVKCGRKEYRMGKDDKIFFNGACYMLCLKEEMEKSPYDRSRELPVVAKSTIKKLLKEGSIVLESKTLAYITGQGKEMFHEYYVIR